MNGLFFNQHLAGQNLTTGAKPKGNSGGAADAAIENLISTFNELNSNVIDELHEEPSPLEFMRYVARNTPFVIRNGASSWKACREWNSAYLLSALKGQSVNVAVTPYGNADMPTVPPGEDSPVFAKPHYEDEPFEELLEYVVLENDNLRDEYVTLFSDVQKDIPFARIALDKSPDAVNLWIGNSKSVTAMHKDNYENIYVQPLRPATYKRGDDGLQLVMDSDDEAVPFAIWDPEKPEQNATQFSHLAKPLRVTLNPGDMLYLPAMWYHKVSQSCAEEDEGFVLAVNYWYDLDFTGPLYPTSAFVRDISLGNRAQASAE
ncbi:hypothetical protein MRS44_012775 [Fusarium solani]|uniref:uncharacterized protein n=1 Tax=Fusarium solani TaxID=169388 RepID=UPI0032C404C6|nr:hypothetical protein MRS44_012775 [Fusarium solani]